MPSELPIDPCSSINRRCLPFLSVMSVGARSRNAGSMYSLPQIERLEDVAIGIDDIVLTRHKKLLPILTLFRGVAERADPSPRARKDARPARRPGTTRSFSSARRTPSRRRP